MKILDQRKMIETMQDDCKIIENRQKEINSLIKQLNNFNFDQNMKFEENHSYSTAKFESKNDYIALLKDFFNNYSNGDKYITIRELFSRLTKKDLSKKKVNSILKNNFNGSKNLIKYLEEEKYDKVIDILKKINKPKIKKPKILNAFLTNSKIKKKINEKIRITNSVFPSNLEKQKTNFHTFQKQSNRDFSEDLKQKSFCEETKNKISSSNDIIPNPPIDFQISSSSSEDKKIIDSRNFSKTTGFKDNSNKKDKSKLKNKNNINKSFNKSSSKLTAGFYYNYKEDKTIIEFKNSFSKTKDNFNVSTYIKKKSPYESVKKKLRRKSFNKINPKNLSTNYSVKKINSKRPPIIIKKKLSVRLKKSLNTKNYYKVQLSERIKNSKNQENFSYTNNSFNRKLKKSNSDIFKIQKVKKNKQSSQQITTKDTLDQTRLRTPGFKKYTSDRSLNFFISKNRKKLSSKRKKSFSIKQIIKKTIKDSPYNICENIGKVNKIRVSKIGYNKQTSILIKEKDLKNEIPNNEVVSFVSKANISSNQFFEANLRSSIEKLDKLPKSSYILNVDIKQKRHYPQYDQTIFNNEVFNAKS